MDVPSSTPFYSQYCFYYGVIFLVLVLFIYIFIHFTRPNYFTCSHFRGVSKKECLALYAVYNKTRGKWWPRQKNWLKLGSFYPISPCKWEGVTCRNGQVSELSLPYSKITGVLPPQIANLKKLRVLDLLGNSLMGVIRREVIQFQQIDLSNIRLCGKIPRRIGYLPLLKIWDLSRNSLCGSVLESFDALVNLKSLKLEKNPPLSCQFPSGVLHLRMLKKFL